jgi:hypothetical protein
VKDQESRNLVDKKEDTEITEELGGSFLMGAEKELRLTASAP